ncbi:hypothetical protein LCGC14_2298390 [marine sediment metagenome]|uniref:NAD-dependent epimerase/dehydratase domain-containing protein n=1 Tax=marine sediment metagenome TaxID=412755 RepID=A0A0F9CPN0_9ZZZZ
MKNILVVGGAGYIGSHTVKALSKAGFQPIVYDDLSSGHKEAVLEAKLIIGELSDRKLLSKIIGEEKIQAVMHFAGIIEVGESVENPAKYLKNNCADGVNLIEAMLENDVKNFIFSSTAAVYGEPDIVPIPETSATQPTNPYGLSKLLFEKTLRYYREQSGLNYISLRYFNAAGADVEGALGADHAKKTHMITLAVMTALGQRDKFELYGTDYETPDGTCIRDYIHVDDLADAHVLALNKLLENGQSSFINLGTGRGHSNKEVIDEVKNISGSDFQVIKTARREGDPSVLVASSEKAKKTLGWQPKYSDLETIVRTAFEWQKSHPNGY